MEYQKWAPVLNANWKGKFQFLQVSNKGCFLKNLKSVFFEYVEQILEKYLVKLNVADIQLYVVYIYIQCTRYTLSSF